MVQQRAGEKKKQLIIDVCKKLFYQKGYNSTTYEDICRAADIPPGTIAYHFDGKRGIAAAIDAEYERQNKIYIEKICGDRYSKTDLMVIENFHMWKRIFEDEHLRRFLLDLSADKLPNASSIDAVRYFYECVMDDQSIKGIDDRELELISAAQIGMSDGLLNALAHSDYEYTYEYMAEFGIRFFMRQIGMSNEIIECYIKRGKRLFDQLPIDNRYYRDFAYDDRYVTPLPDMHEDAAEKGVGGAGSHDGR